MPTVAERDLSHLQLPSRYLAMVQKVLQTHLPGAEVWAYGSRVNGDCFEASDLNLVLRRPCTDEPADVDQAQEAFIESDLPIQVQILDWTALPATFHAEIEAGYVVVQRGLAR
jgi:hypothetical protein